MGMTGRGDVGRIGDIAAGVRCRVLRHVIEHGGGYLGQACSAAEILATLYGGLMQLGPRHGPAAPAPFAGVPGSGREVLGARFNGTRAPSADRFLLSPAHYALALYATLIEVGRLADDALDRFNEDGSTVEMIGAEHSPGMEATTGSLGQALSVAIGIALARRRRGESGRTWVLLSDGECQEGQTWEALQFAAHNGLDNLTVFLDANNSQVDGRVDDIVSVEPIASKVDAFGWAVREVDGHDPAALLRAGGRADRPVFAVARTSPWRGIPSLRARQKFHYVRLDDDGAAAAVADLGLAGVRS